MPDEGLFMMLVTMGIVSSKQLYRTRVGRSIGSRLQDFLGISPSICFTVFSYKLKLYEDCTRELASISEDWSVRVKAAFDLFNHTESNH